MSDLHADLERLRDDLAAYALGALEAAEAAVYERHLDSCASCRERLQWLAPAVDRLPTAVEQISPPPSLRESLMATVRAEAGVAPGPAVAAGREREPWWERLRSAVLQPATGLAVMILLVAGIGTGYLLRGDDSGSEFIAARAVSESAPAASATLERHGDSATLHVNSLPPLERDEVYEVWLQRDGVMEASSTFVLDRERGASAAVPGPLAGAEAVLVTVEQRPGSNQPTTPPLLEAPLR